VRRFVGHDPADASPWVGKIAAPQWEHVDMGVHHRLPRRLAVIDPNVEPVGAILLHEPLPHPSHEPPDRSLSHLGLAVTVFANRVRIVESLVLVVSVCLATE
jgi:hypothetical protein